MNLEKLQASVATQSQPPVELTDGWKVLWFIAKGGDLCWQAAHELAQAMSGSTGAWLHAHLHMREGEEANARYWYGRAQRAPKSLTDSDTEFVELASHLETSSHGLS